MSRQLEAWLEFDGWIDGVDYWAVSAGVAMELEYED